MRVGEMWAYRERAHTLSCPVVRAEILQLGPRKSARVRIRLHEGEFPGLDLWVPTVRLRVPWDEAEAWLRDERALEAARQASEDAMGSVAYDAADVVLSAYPRPDGILLGWPWGSGTVCIPEPAAVTTDLGLDLSSLLSHPLAFVDRTGEFYAPASLAERLARAVIDRYPNQVLAAVERGERELRHEALHGKTISAGLWSSEVSAEECEQRLRQREPVFDLVRKWCGQERTERFDELAHLRREVRRLKDVVIRAAQDLEEAGRPHRASKLRKEAEVGKSPTRPLQTDA